MPVYVDNPAEYGLGDLNDLGKLCHAPLLRYWNQWLHGRVSTGTRSAHGEKGVRSILLNLLAVQ